VDAQRISIGELSDVKNGLFLIAEIGGRIIGNLTFRLGKRPKTAHVGEFGFTVHKNYWGLGIGQLLIKLDLETIKSKYKQIGNQYYVCWFLLLPGKIWYIIQINESEVYEKKRLGRRK
jgi:GNAT superfamily N-acetyltransferase